MPCFKEFGRLTHCFGRWGVPLSGAKFSRPCGHTAGLHTQCTPLQRQLTGRNALESCCRSSLCVCVCLCVCVGACAFCRTPFCCVTFTCSVYHLYSYFAQSFNSSFSFFPIGVLLVFLINLPYVFCVLTFHVQLPSYPSIPITMYSFVPIQPALHPLAFRCTPLGETTDAYWWTFLSS